jgi:hypothetical protein
VLALLQTIRGDRHPATARAMHDLRQDDAQGYRDVLAAQLRTAGLPVTTGVRRGDAATALSDETAEPGGAWWPWRRTGAPACRPSGRAA